MKKSIHVTALPLFAFLLLSSCFVTYETSNIATTQGEKIPIETLECSTNTPENVDAFYPGDTLDFDYTKIGFVTAYAEQGVPDSLILNRLKYNSYLLCGNGVIEVMKSELIKDNYVYKQYSATAVRIVKDSVYYTKYSGLDDFSFYNFSKNDLTYSNEYQEFSPGLTLLSVGITIVGIVISAISPDSEDEDEPDYVEDSWEDGYE